MGTGSEPIVLTYQISYDWLFVTYNLYGIFGGSSCTNPCHIIADMYDIYTYIYNNFDPPNVCLPVTFTFQT